MEFHTSINGTKRRKHTVFAVCLLTGFFCGPPGGIRTLGLQNRNLLRYPASLRAVIKAPKLIIYFFTASFNPFLLFVQGNSIYFSPVRIYSKEGMERTARNIFLRIPILPKSAAFKRESAVFLMKLIFNAPMFPHRLRKFFNFCQ